MLLYVFMCGERDATTTNVTARVLSMKKKNDLIMIKEKGEKVVVYCWIKKLKSMRREGEDIVLSMDRKRDYEKHVVYKMWFL